MGGRKNEKCECTVNFIPKARDGEKKRNQIINIHLL